MIETGEKDQEETRIINVSSDASYLCRNLNLDDLNFVRDNWAGTMWAPFKIYAASKLCNILFSIELSNKFECRGKSFLINLNFPICWK